MPGHPQGGVGSHDPSPIHGPILDRPMQTIIAAESPRAQAMACLEDSGPQYSITLEGMIQRPRLGLLLHSVVSYSHHVTIYDSLQKLPHKEAPSTSLRAAPSPGQKHNCSEGHLMDTACQLSISNGFPTRTCDLPNHRLLSSCTGPSINPLLWSILRSNEKMVDYSSN